MILWWIGNLVLLVVIAPVVVVLLHGVLKEARGVRRAVEDITEVARMMVADLEPVSGLVETDRYVSQTTKGVVRYGRALDEIL